MENQEKPKQSDFQRLESVNLVQKILNATKFIIENFSIDEAKEERLLKVENQLLVLDKEEQELRKRLSGGIARPGIQNGEQPEFLSKSIQDKHLELLKNMNDKTKPTTNNDTTT